MQEWLRGQADLTLAELAERLHTSLGIQIGLSRLCQVLQAMGLPRKKKTLHAAERDCEPVLQARTACPVLPGHRGGN